MVATILITMPIVISISITQTMGMVRYRVAGFVEKGGTGKTTSIGHFGVALEELGFDVLLIDLAGKQGDLGKLFGLQDEIAEADDWPNIATAFQPEWEDIKDRIGTDAAVDSLVWETSEGPDLIPAHEGLDSLDAELQSKYDGAEMYRVLDRFLSADLSGRYDTVLVDLPGVSNNISYNGLWACGNVLCPVDPARIEAEQAEALAEDLEQFRDAYDRPAQISMLLPNKTDHRTRLTREFLEEYRSRYPEVIAPVPIPRSQDIQNAADQGSTIFALESPSKTATRAMAAYRVNAATLLHRLGADVAIPEDAEAHLREAQATATDAIDVTTETETETETDGAAPNQTQPRTQPQED